MFVVQVQTCHASHPFAAIGSDNSTTILPA